MYEILNQDYWNERYLVNNIGWDLGVVSPPLKSIIDNIDNKNAAILIPGAGNAYEAEYLLLKGFTNVTVIDIAPSVVQNLQEKYQNNSNVNIVLIDFFEQEMTFDIILEQTFFCAINPDLRKTYVEKMHQSLNENGLLIGVLFNKEFEGGPPFSGSIEEYRKLFSNQFKINKLETCLNSIAPRLGFEVVVEFQKI